MPRFAHLLILLGLMLLVDFVIYAIEDNKSLEQPLTEETKHVNSKSYDF